MRYAEQGRKSNSAIVLSERMGKELSKYFMDSMANYREGRFVIIEKPAELMAERRNELEKLLDNAVAYKGENIEEMKKCQLYICEAACGDKKYYFCSKQNPREKTLFQQGTVVLKNSHKAGDELEIEPLNQLFLMRTAVDFVVNPDENRIIFRDSKSYEHIVAGDDVQESVARKNINIVDDWTFIMNAAFIKERVFQKNVYSNLYRIFKRKQYLEEMKKISPAKFKWFLLHKYVEKFSEVDFAEDRLIITSHNMEFILKILAKGIDTIWLEINNGSAEDEIEDEDETILPMKTIKMCKKVGFGFVLEEDEKKSREKQIRRFLAVLNQACKSDSPEGDENTENVDKKEKQTTGIFEYFKSNGVKLRGIIHGKETWFEINETDFQKTYVNEDERKLLIKGLCGDRFFNLLLSDTKRMD